MRITNKFVINIKRIINITQILNKDKIEQIDGIGVPNFKNNH